LARHISIPYIAIFFITLWPNFALAGAKLSLSEAESLAMQHNAALSASSKRAEALSNVPAQVGSLPDPVLSLNALNIPLDSFSTTQENMTQLQLGFSQAIPYPGKLGLRAELASFLTDAAVSDLEEFKQQLASRVKSSWWSLFYLDRAKETIRRNQQLLRQLIRIAESKYKVGQGLQQDVLLAQLELSKLLDVAIQLKSARRQEEAALNGLLNRSPLITIELPEQVEESLHQLASESELLERALSGRPLLAKYEHFISAAQSRVALAEKDYYPDFNVGSAYGIRNGTNPANNKSRPDFATLRINITLPFFTKDKYDHQLDQRKAEQASSEFAYQDAKLAVFAEVSQTLASYQRAKEQTLLFKTGIIPQAQQTVASMMVAYQVNKVDFLNLVRSQIILYNYETQYWKALAEANQSLARLTASVGKGIYKEYTHE